MKLIERTCCPSCNNKDLKELFSLNYIDQKMTDFLENFYGKSKMYFFKNIKNEKYILNECNRCEMIFQKFIPDKKFGMELYENIVNQDQSFKKKESLEVKNFKEYFNDAIMIENILKKKNKDIDILDFGAGWGIWSKFIKACNFKVEACEVSKKRANYIKDSGIKVHEDIATIDTKFDFIYSNQTIEHLTDPIETISNLSKLLKKNGYIYFKFPNTKFFKKKINKKYYPKKDPAHPLEHINLFTKNSFINLISNTNLEISNDLNKYEIKKNILRYFINLFQFKRILLKNAKLF